jgi:pimeloyl-ACP methyl ester carboxylesterase
VSDLRHLRLQTGVKLNVALAGDPANPPVILMHGFPESHRTWREVAPRLEGRFRLVMPDLRGFADSDLPQEVDDYKADTLVGDIFALADALDIERFALVGHDWGGAIAWAAAIHGDPRLTRLGIVNSPHPAVFQKSLIENAGQLAASQYISSFRAPGFEKMVEDKGYDWFFDTTFARHVDMSIVSDEERQRYIADWSKPGAFNAMLNWYRASRVVVPPPGVTVPMPDFLLHAFPTIKIPTLVVWGMKDPALLPVQLDGLDELVDDLAIVRLPGVGHFAPWEAGEQVAAALEPFLAGQAAATAPAK